MKRPYLVVHTVASVDGRVSLGPDRTAFDDVADERWQRMWAPGPDLEQTRRDVMSVYQPQVLLEGSGSFAREGARLQPLARADLPPATLLEDFLPDSVVNAPSRLGWLAAVDGRGRIRAGMKEFPGWEGWHTLHLVARTTPHDYLAFLRRREIPYLVCGEGHVDLAGALGKMARLLGVGCVVSTAGSKLNGALLREGLVDELDLVLLPALIGGTSTPALFGCSDLGVEDDPTPLELLSLEQVSGSRVHVRYKVVRHET